jgi:hypothetical protein
VILKWATSAEQNNKYFTIERSTDGINFNFLARVNGAGNSNNLINYQAVDYTPVDGINYYRLSQTNIDDRTAYFDIKAITYKSKYSFTSSFANQTNGIKVSINSSKNDNIRLRIVDFTGREVTKDMFYISTGTLVKNYSLAKGTYIIQLSNSNKETINTKIIIK